MPEPQDTRASACERHSFTTLSAGRSLTGAWNYGLQIKDFYHRGTENTEKAVTVFWFMLLLFLSALQYYRIIDTMRHTPIRMIALDLDGTLLRSDCSIGTRTVKALQAAKAIGVEIVLASGRMTPAMEQTAALLGLDVCLVSYNGAVVCSRLSDGRKRLYHCPLNAGIARELFAYAHPRQYQINFYYEDVIVSEDGPHLRPFIDIYRTRTGSPYRIVERLDAYLECSPTKLLFLVDPSLRNGIENDIRPLFETRATIIRTDPEYLEFLDPSVDKGKGLVKLAAILGIEMTHVMAMGDGENDVPMLQAAGWGVAVANAKECCMAVAKAITISDHNNDAVAEAVERWVL